MITVHVDSTMSDEERAFKLDGALNRSETVKLVTRQKLCDLSGRFVTAKLVYAEGDELVVEVILHSQITYSDELES